MSTAAISPGAPPAIHIPSGWISSFCKLMPRSVACGQGLNVNPKIARGGLCGPRRASTCGHEGEVRVALCSGRFRTTVRHCGVADSLLRISSAAEAEVGTLHSGAVKYILLHVVVIALAVMLSMIRPSTRYPPLEYFF